MNATDKRNAAIKLAATGAFLLFSVYAFALLLSVPAALAAPYDKQAASTADDARALQAIEGACVPYLEAVDEVKRVEGLVEIEDETGAWLVPGRDADAEGFSSIEAAAADSSKLVEGKVRVGSTIFSSVSTTALSRGDVSTSALAERLGIEGFSIRADGFLIDGDGYAACIATSPFHAKGDVLDTPIGKAKVYDVTWGLDKVACFAS